MTGGGYGRCSGGVGLNRGGLGRFGRGRGCGRGWGGRGGWSPPAGEASAGNEAEALAAQAQQLEQSLHAVNERLAELRHKSD